LSVKIAQKQLLPRLAQQDEATLIVASGSSCQQQIADLSLRKALHPAEVFAQALRLDTK